MQPEVEHAEMKRLLLQNQELLKDNNRLLHKMHRHAIWMFWFRLCFYLIILGAPVILYFYVLEPYIASMGASYQDMFNNVNQLLNSFNGIDRVIKQLE